MSELGWVSVDGVLTTTNASPPPRDPAVTNGTRFDSPAAWGALWLASALGTVLIAVSFSLAATDGSDTLHHALFWAGTIVFFLPTAIVLTARQVAVRVRFGWLAAYGLLTYVPKLLRNPGQPVFPDEIAHWRQAADLAGSGQLFQHNDLVALAGDFPGLHLVTASISASTGLTVWQSALLVVVIAHVLALFGAFMLGEAVFGSLRAGGTVALLYSLNPGFGYADAEFGSRSLAIPLFLWCLACLARAHRADTARERGAWTAAASVAGVGAVPVHHLTAIVLAGLLLAFWSGAAIRATVPVEAARATLLVASAVAVCALLWLAMAAPAALADVWRYLDTGTGQLLNGASRSVTPTGAELGYERLARLSVPPVALMVAAIALLRRRRAGGISGEPLEAGLGLLGLLYFAPLPFLRAPSAAEGVRHSWGLTWIGLAVLGTPVVLSAVDRITGLEGRRAMRAALVVVLVACDTLVGNLAAGADESHRFPGPFVFGSDTRSATPELVDTAAWMRSRLGERLVVVSDRYTGLVLIRDDDAHPVRTGLELPAYQLWFDPGPPSDRLVGALGAAHAGYLVIDKRMAVDRPQTGYFFEPDEPYARTGGNLVTEAGLARYGVLPWTTRVYDSDSYAVYRLDLSAVHAPVPGAAR